MKDGVGVTEATHVKTKNGQIKKIASTWGIDKEGHLAKPSEGGFGVITEDGQRVSMYDARSYLKEE